MPKVGSRWCATPTAVTRTYDARGRLLTVSAVDVEERYTYGSDEASAVLDCATGQALDPSFGAGRLTKRAIRLHFKDFQVPCGFVALRMTDDGFDRAATLGPERSGSFWTEWMRGGSITSLIAATGCAAGEQPTAEIDQFEVELGSSEAQTVSHASASPYPAAGQQFEVDLGAGGYAYFDRNTPATCDRLKARDAAGNVLWQGPNDRVRVWTTRLSGKVSLGIWGQGCNATEKVAGFTITKLMLDKPPPVAVRFAWPGQYADDATGLVENWNRYYDPSIGRYLQPEPILQTPDLVVLAAQEGRGTPAYSYALDNPVNVTDETGLYAYAAWCAGKRPDQNVPDDMGSLSVNYPGGDSCGDCEKLKTAATSICRMAWQCCDAIKKMRDEACGNCKKDPCKKPSHYPAPTWPSGTGAG